MNLRRGIMRVVAPFLIVATISSQHGCAASEIRPSSISEPNRSGDDRSPVVRATPGSRIDITREDGTVLHGLYLGVERMNAVEYVRHWEGVRGHPPGTSDGLPVPGEIVRVRAQGRRIREESFQGFGSRTIQLRDSTGLVDATSWSELIEMSTADGRSWSGGSFADSAAQGRLPVILCVRLGRARGEVLVPADQIAEARDRTSHPLATGLLVGLAVGTIIGLAALSEATLHGPWFGP